MFLLLSHVHHPFSGTQVARSIVSVALNFQSLCMPKINSRKLPEEETLARILYDAWYMYVASRSRVVTEPDCCPSCGYFPDIIMDGRAKTSINMQRGHLQVMDILKLLPVQV